MAVVDVLVLHQQARMLKTNSANGPFNSYKVAVEADREVVEPQVVEVAEAEQAALEAVVAAEVAVEQVVVEAVGNHTRSNVPTLPS